MQKPWICNTHVHVFVLLNPLTWVCQLWIVTFHQESLEMQTSPAELKNAEPHTKAWEAAKYCCKAPSMQTAGNKYSLMHWDISLPAEMQWERDRCVHVWPAQGQRRGSCSTEIFIGHCACVPFQLLLPFCTHQCTNTYTHTDRLNLLVCDTVHWLPWQ